jgi:NAD(P)-dependent dehydrogenase (short-subunit alcohol dehydrogenase family)
VEGLGKAAVAAFGRVDVALNCTGWGLLAKLLETSEEDLDKLVALQFKGPYFFLQTFVGLMAQSGGGSVITTSSESVYAGLFDHAAYIGTKAGTDAVVRCFANEFGAKGVKVNSISPGVTETPMTADKIAVPGIESAFLKEYPMGRIGTTEDIANAAVWLASDESFVTGEVLHVSGGLRLRRNPLPWEIEASVVAAMAKK